MFSLANIYLLDFINSIQSGFEIAKWYVVLVLAIGLLLSFIDLAQKKYRFTIKNIIVLWLAYTTQSGLRILVIILAIPIILLLFLIQPVLALVFLIAIATLVIFCLGLFFEEPIVGNPPSPQAAFWGLVCIVACLGIWWLYRRIFKSEGALFDRFADFYVEYIYQPVQQQVEHLRQKMDN